MKDDKNKKYIATQKAMLSGTPRKPKEGGTDAGLPEQQYLKGGNAVPPENDLKDSGTFRDNEKPESSINVTPDNPPAPQRAWGENSAPRKSSVIKVSDAEPRERDWDEDPAVIKRGKSGGREPIPAWSLILLFAVIIILAAISLYFFVLRNNETSAPGPSETPIETIEPTPTPTLTPTPTPTEVPTPTPVPTPVTMWGANFPGKFTTGEVVKNDSTVMPTISELSSRFQKCKIEAVKSYRSAHVNVTVNKVQEKGITYFVSDIYITDLKYLISAFSSGKYKGSTEHVYKIAQKKGAIVAINGDFYTRNEGPVLRNGKLYRNEEGHDMLVMLKDGTMQTYAKGKFDKNTIKELKGNTWQIWTFGPMLLKDGEKMTKFNLPVSNIGGVNPRTAIGYYEPGHYVFVTVDGRQKGYSYPGYSMKQLSQLMYDLGCKVAFNLDGGASAQMAFLGKKVSRPCWSRRDPDAVLIVDEPAPKESAAPTAGN